MEPTKNRNGTQALRCGGNHNNKKNQVRHNNKENEMFSGAATRRYSTARTQKEHVGKIAKKSGMVWKDSRVGTMWKTQKRC